MMENQTTNTLLMVQPVAFGFNQQTAGNNYFQQQDDMDVTTIQEQALDEFNRMVHILNNKGINLIIAIDTPEPHTPDSIFPSNWISFHDDGTVAIYPMFAENRRLERRVDILKQIEHQEFTIRHIIDYSKSEKEHLFLEGTGSMVLDRENRIAYAALSERTNKDLFLKFCNDFRFDPVCFHAYQQVGNERLPVYHTNVMMSVWSHFAVVCLEAVDNITEWSDLVNSLQETEKVIISITEEQMYRFAGNMIQVENNNGEKFLVMSGTAYRSLTKDQIKRLAGYNQLVSIDIPTIEKYGGGSIRCMMAEIFLPKNSNT